MQFIFHGHYARGLPHEGFDAGAIRFGLNTAVHTRDSLMDVNMNVFVVNGRAQAGFQSTIEIMGR